MNNSSVSLVEAREKINQAISQARSDPTVLFNKFLYTFDPRLEHPNIPFNLFDYQVPLVGEYKSAIENGYDLFVDKSRDVGATYTLLGVFLWFWLFIEGSNFLVGSRKQDYVDNRFGTTSDSDLSNKEESLFGKLEYLIAHAPGFIMPEGFNISKHMGYMRLLNPVNGNIITGESSNPNFSRGGRFKAVALDEFAFWDNDTAAWGSTADTANCRIVLTTPGIRPNTKAERLRFARDGEQIKVVEIDYKQDPRKGPEWEKAQRQRRSVEDFAREVARSWKASRVGLVYGKEIELVTRGNFPYNPDWPLYISWDFGLDGTAVQAWQHNIKNGKKRLIDSYFKINEVIYYFFPLFGMPIDSMYIYSEDDLDAIRAFKEFKKGVHFGDPDAAKRGYQTQKKVSTREALQKAGIYVQTNPEANDFYTRWEKTKVMLQNGIEVNDTPRNLTWIEAMEQARFPQRPENSQITTEPIKPVHDWTSHHRTSTEFFAVNYSPPAVRVVQQASPVMPFFPGLPG